MKPIQLSILLAASVLTLGSGFSVGPSLAQRSEKVRFAPGNDGTMLSCTITGRESFDYRLTASKGQKMFAELTVKRTNGNGNAFFNILPPGSKGEAIYVGHMDDDRSALVTLPASGTYILRVYLKGNDKDASKTVGFNLDHSIQ